MRTQTAGVFYVKKSYSRYECWAYWRTKMPRHRRRKDPTRRIGSGKTPKFGLVVCR